MLARTSADAEVWPEVQLSDGRWLALDPVPAEEANDGAPPPPEPQVQTPAAPQPPIAPPPEPDNETSAPDEATTAESTGALSTAIAWVIRGTVAIGVLLLPFAAAAAVIMGIKYRRRRRRLRAGVPSERIRGAWASATDALVDAGLDISRSETDGEIVGHGEPLVADARRHLRRLAALAGAATFGSPEHPDLLAEDATMCLGAVEESMAAAAHPVATAPVEAQPALPASVDALARQRLTARTATPGGRNILLSGPEVSCRGVPPPIGSQYNSQCPLPFHI